MGWDVNVDTWNARPDVLSTMQGADSGNPGFQQSVDLSSLAPGNYKLTVVFSDAGASRICNPNRALVIE